MKQIDTCILINRKIINSEIWQKPPLYIKVWLYLLISAQHKAYKGLKRGQLRTSISELQDACSHRVGYRIERPSRDQIYQIINWLRKPDEADTESEPKATPGATMIATTKATQGMLVNITNYSLYQALGNYGSNDESNGEGNDENAPKPNREQRQPNNINKNDKNGKNEKNKAFVPPTLTEVEEYCRQRNNGVDPKKFFDFFTAGDWIDSKGKPVRRWKQKIITWEQYNAKETPSAPATPKRRFITTGTDDIGNPTGYFVDDFVDEGSDATA